MRLLHIACLFFAQARLGRSGEMTLESTLNFGSGQLLSRPGESCFFKISAQCTTKILATLSNPKLFPILLLVIHGAC